MKNIVVLFITGIITVITLYFFMSIKYNRYRFDPAEIVQKEVQYCETVNDCTSLNLSCTSGCDTPISKSNKKRYEILKEKHCELNKPKAYFCGYWQCPQKIACNNNVCQYEKDS